MADRIKLNDLKNETYTLFDLNEHDLWQLAKKFLDEHCKYGVRCLFSTHKMKSGKYKGKPVTRYEKTTDEAEAYAHKHNTYCDRRLWNWYIMINTLKSWRRGNDNIGSFTGLYCDVDCEKFGISLSDFNMHHEQILKLAGLPEPNLYILSGHGFYFVWLFSQPHVLHYKELKPHSKVKGFFNLWQHLEHWKRKTKHKKHGVVDCINRACKKVFGKEPVDTSAVDPTRVLRLVDTNNMKNYYNDFAKCELETFNPKTYPMQAWWVKKILPPYYSNKHNKRNTHKKNKGKGHIIPFIPNNFGPNSWRWAIRKDLLNWACKAEFHYRDMTLFHLMCADSHIRANEDIKKDLKEANKRLPDSYSDDRLSDFFDEVDNTDLTKYTYTTESIIEDVGMTKDKIFQIHDKALKLPPYKAKNIKRDQIVQDHQKARQRKYKRVVNLINRGLSFRKIHKQLGVSMGLISKIKQKYKATPIRSKAPKLHYRKRVKRRSRCPYFKTRYLLMNEVPIGKIHNLLGITTNETLRIKERYDNDKGQQQLLGEIINRERKKKGFSS